MNKQQLVLVPDHWNWNWCPLKISLMSWFEWKVCWGWDEGGIPLMPWDGFDLVKICTSKSSSLSWLLQVVPHNILSWLRHFWFWIWRLSIYLQSKTIISRRGCVLHAFVFVWIIIKVCLCKFWLLKKSWVSLRNYYYCNNELLLIIFLFLIEPGLWQYLAGPRSNWPTCATWTLGGSERGENQVEWAGNKNTFMLLLR